MHLDHFICVGENLHCTRVFKVGGKSVQTGPDGRSYIAYTSKGQARQLPVPPAFTGGADWQAGKVKHCAVAIWQGNYGDEAGQAAGIDYLQSLAREQQAHGARFLDVNVDEFSTDVAERMKLIKWTLTVIQRATSIPISVDSSNLGILTAGLQACSPAKGRPMVNSVSLERPDAVKAAAEHRAVVIASAAGEKGMPSSPEERLANLISLMPKLKASGFQDLDIHVDPLVFPISVDPSNGSQCLKSISAIRHHYGDEIHIVAGLSNISFGMPNRKLINQVFSQLAVEAGADGGIVDPLQVNVPALMKLDKGSEPYKMARAMLLGEDEFGMNWIAACREGKIAAQ